MKARQLTVGLYWHPFWVLHHAVVRDLGIARGSKCSLERTVSTDTASLSPS